VLPFRCDGGFNPPAFGRLVIRCFQFSRDCAVFWPLFLCVARSVPLQLIGSSLEAPKALGANKINITCTLPTYTIVYPVVAQAR